MSILSRDPLPRVAFIGSYVPRRCGIATFTHDLASVVSERVYRRPLSEGGWVTVVALNDRGNSYEYGPEVTFQIRQHSKEDYRSAVDFLNHSKANVVCLQHEFGLFGGQDGDYLLELLDRLRKPLVSTFHTVLSQPSAAQREVLRRVSEHSASVVVMSRRSKELLLDGYGIPSAKVSVIPHGTPDVPYEATEPFKERFGLGKRPLILTFGLLSPNKGIEVMLDALVRVVPEFPDLAYLVLGITHPLVRRESGESYRLSLESRAVAHKIQKNVIFHNRYVSLDDLCEYLLAADIYVTPYVALEQIVSGTLAYALASGRAIISTPYYYAQELLGDGRGRLIDFGDVEALAANLNEFLGDPEKRDAVRKAAYAYGRSMTWPKVGTEYVEIFREVGIEAAARVREVASGEKAPMRLSLPGVRLRHLLVMTDDTGILQHSVYSTPDRRHGYTTDDNCRALIVMMMIWSLFKDETVLPYIQTYLSFLLHAQGEKGRRLHNFMSYERRWLDKEGGDDCQGRVLWALGHLLSKSPSELTRRLAEELFRVMMRSLPEMKSLRAWAFSILGLHYYLGFYEKDEEASSSLLTLASQIDDAFHATETDSWPWNEDIVTYDNARVPQALIIAGFRLGREDLVERGIRILEWLLRIQTSEKGHLSIIGNKGWLRRGGEKADFDQQPVEAAALIGACKAAHRATGDVRWLVEMRRCFEWYLGRNDVGCSLIDFKTYGCYDALTPDGVNRNQGAESVISWLLSLLIMHEMQTGEAPEVA